VRLPRFEFETSLALSETLASLGMPAAFDGGSGDFGGMVEGGDGSLSLDEAYVAVDETGTEAAATGGAVIDSSNSVPFDLTFDRPFIFCIRDRRTDTVVFLGRVVDAGTA
jgi:serpin B